MDNLEKIEETQNGIFQESLQRNNSKIRKDRASAIAEDAEVIYKRKVEDFSLQIKKLKRERSNLLDLSPTHADSLILATDFDSESFSNKDIEMGVQIRNLEIKLEIALNRYQELFGKTVSLS